MSEQKWLQCVGLHAENKTPLYYEYESAAMPVPAGWSWVGNNDGRPLWSPPEAIVFENGVYSLYPSTPLASAVPYSEPLPPLLPLFNSFPGYPSLAQASEKISMFTLFKESLLRSGHKVSSLTLHKLDGKQKHAKELDRILDECMEFLIQKNEELSKNSKILEYSIGFYHPEKISKYFFLPNLRNKLLEKLAQNKARLTNINVILDDPIGERCEKVNTPQFPENVGLEATTALDAWKESLTTLLKEAGTDEKKLKVVEAYVEETQNVIHAVNNAFALNKQGDSPDRNVAQVTLLSALESFQAKILKISDNENALRDASRFLGALVGAIIGVALALLFLPPVVFFAWILGAAIGLAIAHYGVNNAIGVDAVDPKQKDFISNKLTEFGIFGNTPKHKARTFLDAIREETGVGSSEAKKVGVEEVSAQPVAPMPAPVLVPLYLGVSQ